MSALVDWSLAERTAAAVGRRETGTPEPEAPEEVLAACEDAGELVLSYTGLRPTGPLPRPELVDREAWAHVALATVRDLTDHAERSLPSGSGLQGALGSAVRPLAAAALGLEIGALAGVASRRVIGQYDLPLLGAERPPRLLFVWPNLAAVHGQLGETRSVFVRWIALHEVTHAVQFSAVPWLRAHLGGLVEGLTGGMAAQADLAALRRRAGALLRSDPRETLRALLGGELTKLLAGPEQARLLDELQAAMSLIEGYAEHVMDRADPEHAGAYSRLRERLAERRARRGGLTGFLERLLGFDLKLRQYEVGKRFCDRVAAETGIAGLNRAWSEPAALPTAAELEAPEAWLERADRLRARAA